MNHISIQKIKTQYGYEEEYWSIDRKSLPDYLDECIAKSNDTYLKNIGSFNGFCPAWSKELDFNGDVRFVWELVQREKKTVLPILLCPDDLDFSCTVIVVEVDKTKDFVYWNRIGYVTHKNEDFEEEKRRGIINYTLPYYETQGNVCWFLDLNWCFECDEYEAMVREFWERTTLQQLQNILKQDNNRKMNVKECADLIADLTLDGKVLLQEHIKDYNEVLLHLFATDMISEPLMALFDRCNENTLMIDCYITLIEIMWKKGDGAVCNVVDVTILERLSDEEAVWQRFGKLISTEFKSYINQEILPTNLMMCGVKTLE